MTRGDMRLDSAGLFRCCIESVRRWIEEDPQQVVHEGERVRCQWCKAPTQMRVTGNLVHWDRGDAK